VLRGPQMEAIDRAVDQIASSIMLNRPERWGRSESLGGAVRDTLHSLAGVVLPSARLASVRHRAQLGGGGPAGAVQLGRVSMIKSAAGAESA
jgi:hypothetical protein